MCSIIKEGQRFTEKKNNSLKELVRVEKTGKILPHFKLGKVNIKRIP